MLNAIIVFFEMLWCKHLKHFWSKLRWWKQRKEVSKEVIHVDDTNLKAMAQDVYRNYKWTMDDWTEFFDSMRPAPSLYNEYLAAKETPEADKVLDDCDGFHTIIYHILKNNGYNVALITVVTNPITKSHTMCLIKDGPKSFRVVNYTTIKGPYATIQEFIDDYSTPARCWCLDGYNYEKKKFYNIDEKRFEEEE